VTSESQTKLRGAWAGRLIDVAGVEGAVTFTLVESRGKVKGTFDARMDGQHSPVRRSGKIAGQLEGRALKLTLELGSKENPVSIAFTGKLTDTRSKDQGTCGIYSVSARRPAGLLGGVLSARSLPPGGKVQDSVLNRSTTAEVSPRSEPDAGKARARVRRRGR
jgi:hypothetical protein